MKVKRERYDEIALRRFGLRGRIQDFWQRGPGFLDIQRENIFTPKNPIKKTSFTISYLQRGACHPMQTRLDRGGGPSLSLYRLFE